MMWIIVDSLQAQSTAARLELTNYLTYLRVLRSSDIAKLFATNSDSHNAENLKFWKDRQNMYLKLHVLAEDLIAAPASKPYCEHILSLISDFQI